MPAVDHGLASTFAYPQANRGPTALRPDNPHTQTADERRGAPASHRREGSTGLPVPLCVRGRAGAAWQVGSSGRSAPQGASLMRVWDVADLRWFTGLSLPRWSIEAPRSPLPYPRQVGRSTRPIARRRPAVDRGRRRCRTIATSLRAPAEAWSIWEGTSSWLGWPSGGGASR